MINELSVFIDKHIYAVRISIGVAGFAGFALILHKAQVFRVYKHISEIPDEVIQKRVLLRGLVQNISEDGSIKVEHQSTLFKKFFRAKENEYLDVRLAGITPMYGWLSFMNNNLQNRKIRFILLNKDNVSDAIVHKNKGIFSRKQSINEAVLKHGVAVVTDSSPETLHSKHYNKLIRTLVKVEAEADKRGKEGVWKRESWFQSWRR